MNFIRNLIGFIFLLFIENCVSQRELQNHETLSFIASLIPQANVRNPENARNVLLIRLDRGPNFKLFNDITKKIMQACPENPVIIHTDLKPFNKNAIRAVSFMIVTVDYFDPVMIKKKKFSQNFKT